MVEFDNFQRPTSMSAGKGGRLKVAKGSAQQPTAEYSASATLIGMVF
jgi:hypothetical protein